MRTAAVATALGAAAAFLSAGTASAEELAPRTATVTTVDGWDVSVTASDLSVHPVPNLAGSPFTREGFVSATVTGEVQGQGTAPVRSGKVEQGIQIGCGVDVSSGATLGLNATFGPNVGITMAGPSAGLSATAGPSVSIQVKPGQITSLSLGEKQMQGPAATISAHGVHLKVDGCWGPVSVRTFAMVAISTDTSDDSAYVYSDPTWL
ncbi:MspA family porin [Tomitella gaofuii]|uniref:MspA family porin n=1 Tax=Tomitella gaofuii TaxID=2760083 RepID=UPI0015F9B5AD|nr:MspA family porin [Tomitella gaofuii]